VNPYFVCGDGFGEYCGKSAYLPYFQYPWAEQLREISSEGSHVKSMLFVGRGIHYPIAREAALKLKECAYLQADGYPSGELKHGPNALLDTDTPLVMLATVDRGDERSVRLYRKTLQLMKDMRAQKARIVCLANAGYTEVPDLADRVIEIEETSDILLAISEVIPLQLLAYFTATSKGLDVDRSRNLTKAVLSE